jgi:hypothetical protein
MDTRELEDFVRTARVIQSGPMPGGGGHRDKQVVVLTGGVGAVATLAEAPDPVTYVRVRAEQAAWVLAQELGWEDLVPVTSQRVVESIFSHRDAVASVQVVWPIFQTAAELQVTAQQCPDSEIWRVAIFDALAKNSDRHAGNWGFVGDLRERPRLIDHGHAFDASQAIQSEFVNLKRGQTLQEEEMYALSRLLERRRTTRLAGLLEPTTLDQIMSLAQAFVDSGVFSVSRASLDNSLGGDMSEHVDILKVEPLAASGAQALARVWLHAGQIDVEAPDSHYWRDLLARITRIDPDESPEEFFAALQERIDGTYIYATEPHDDAHCPAPGGVRARADEPDPARA